jgi:hypothetical protein
VGETALWPKERSATHTHARDAARTEYANAFVEQPQPVRKRGVLEHMLVEDGFG